jgi:hypothetical protein
VALSGDLARRVDAAIRRAQAQPRVPLSPAGQRLLAERREAFLIARRERRAEANRTLTSKMHAGVATENDYLAAGIVFRGIHNIGPFR